MTMKKILAGVLAAATMLSISATAFALEAPDKTKPITKPGEAEYEAGIGLMTAELDVELPGSMKAFLNPYGAEVAVTDVIETSKTEPAKNADGVLSWAYEVVNNTTDFGIAIDVKKGAVATPSTGVTVAAPSTTAPTAKSVMLQLMAATAPSGVKFDGSKGTSTACTSSAQGVYVFSSTASTDSFANVAYAPAKTDAAGAGKVYLGLVGNLGKKDASSKAIEWTEDDLVTATFTLKINPTAKTQATAFT